MDDESVRHATVHLLHALRNEYLRAGASSIHHWNRLHDRMRAAARMTTSAPEWATQLQRGLGLSGASSAFSARTRDLVAAVGGEGHAFLDLIEREHAYLMALTRLAADEQRRAKKKVSAA